jgi:transcriptional regulator with GAF, ATPase, and Fis domain
VASGSFRQDLFYRLNIFPIEVPPVSRHNSVRIKSCATHRRDRSARST